MMNDSAKYKSLVIAQMALESVSTSTISVFAAAFDILNKSGCSVAEVAKKSWMTPQAARLHMHRLVALGYVDRLSYRCWKASPKILRNPELIEVAQKLGITVVRTAAA